ncbi:hypothetical protein D3C73_662240 [compost metagenome]
MLKQISDTFSTYPANEALRRDTYSPYINFPALPGGAPNNATAFLPLFPRKQTIWLQLISTCRDMKS